MRVADPQWTCASLAEQALLLEWHGQRDHAPQVLRQAMMAINAAQISGVIELVPGIKSLLVCVDPLRLSVDELDIALRPLLPDRADVSSFDGTVHEIPVVYGAEAGPDLPSVAAACMLTEDEVVDLHTGLPMPVLMIGFMPGFPYIGGLPPQLHLPRRSEPRTIVPAGSIAIANDQTGIYPNRSPGGWHIIGRTVLRLFDPYREPPALLNAGDWVRFVAITP